MSNPKAFKLEARQMDANDITKKREAFMIYFFAGGHKPDEESITK